MNILELFSGTGSFSKIAREHKHKTWTVDFDKQFAPDLVADIEYLSLAQIPFKPDIIWASPPCETFSVAGFGQHIRVNGIAIDEKSKKADRVIIRTIKLIRDIAPRFWIIENPVGLLRKMPFMHGIPRVTVTYCQYGFKRMKPTDLFGKLPNSFIAKRCHNGDICHIRAPRGSQTGTQGLRRIDAAIVPPRLCEDIIQCCKKELTV